MRIEATSDADLVLHEVQSVFADIHGGQVAIVTLQSDLRSDLGFDSLALVELHDRLEGAFGVTFSEDVLAAATPGESLLAVREARGETGRNSHQGARRSIDRAALRGSLAGRGRDTDRGVRLARGEASGPREHPPARLAGPVLGGGYLLRCPGGRSGGGRGAR